MLVTASTILDRPANVRRFVQSNLALGVDHLFVFVDAPDREDQAEVVEGLHEHPHVTCIPTGRDWWRGDRPSRLNVRQRINANAVVQMLAGVDQVEWVFHVDGDETVAVDRSTLASVPADTDAVWLTPLEAVSARGTLGSPTSFKRLLDDEDLQLLTLLGVLGSPTNQALFHGHVLGKSGVRPGSGLGLALHDAVAPPGRRLRPHERFADPRLRVLHYDAVSAEEFARKWRAMVAAGPVSLRPDRAPLAMALRSLVAKDVAPEVAEKYLHRLYELTTEDDVATLEELGMLERVDPREGTHRPEPFTEGSRSVVEERLAWAHHQPKRDFHLNHGGDRRPQEGATPWRRVRRRLGRR